MTTLRWTRWLLLAAAAVVVACSSSGPVEAPALQAPTTPVASATTAGPQVPLGESTVLTYPDDLLVYWSYLDVIGGQPGAADTLVLEATLLSLSTSEVCPYQEEECSIEPYPSHWGVVTIDQIISYAPYADQGQPAVVEQSGEPESPPGDTTPGYTGSEQQPEAKGFAPLEVGQQVEAIFLLTVDAVKVRYAPMVQAQQAWPTAPSAEDSERTAAHAAQPGHTVFKPIPRQGDSLVFTTRIGDDEAAVEKALPGLQVGSTFRAQVKYDGILYVEEYELMP